MLRRRILPLTMCLLVVGGCGKVPVIWQCEFQEESGLAVFDTDAAKIVFEGVKIKPTAGREGGGSSGSMQVTGSGTSVIKLTALGQQLTNSYSGNINTVTLGEYSVRFTDGGRKLVIGAATFEIGKNKQTIIIHQDGSAAVHEN